MRKLHLIVIVVDVHILYRFLKHIFTYYVNKKNKINTFFLQKFSFYLKFVEGLNEKKQTRRAIIPSTK